MLNKVECPYCKEKACFFISGGAIFRRKGERRVRLKLACHKCRGEFVYIEEGDKIETFGIIEPPGDVLGKETMTNAAWASQML